MRILYGAGKLCGANSRLSRFLTYNFEEIKIAAYIKNHEFLNQIDWSLDALNKKWQDTEQGKLFINDIEDWAPDLIISDFEPITARIAKERDIPLWSCSPVHLIDGAFLDIKRNALMKVAALELAELKHAERHFIYSPFCNLVSRPILKDGFEWIEPYPGEEPKSILPCPKWACTIRGDTCSLTDSLYNQKTICISPNDVESLINAKVCEYFQLGINIGDINKSLKYSLKKMESLKKLPIKLDMQPWGYLHEKIYEY